MGVLSVCSSFIQILSECKNVIFSYLGCHLKSATISIFQYCIITLGRIPNYWKLRTFEFNKSYKEYVSGIRFQMSKYQLGCRISSQVSDIQSGSWYPVRCRISFQMPDNQSDARYLVKCRIFSKMPDIQSGAGYPVRFLISSQMPNILSDAG